MNSKMRLFSKKLVTYIRTVYLKNNNLPTHVVDMVGEKPIGWCRCCGEPIPQEAHYFLIRGNITDMPELGTYGICASTPDDSYGFIIHKENCTAKNKKFKKLKENQSLNYPKTVAIQLKQNIDPVIKKESKDDFEKGLDKLNSERLILMKSLKKDFAGTLSEEELDRKTKIMDRLRIVGNHIRLAKNEHQSIKRNKNIK